MTIAIILAVIAAVGAFAWVYGDELIQDDPNDEEAIKAAEKQTASYYRRWEDKL